MVEQIIRPTGLMDPVVEIRKATGQVDDALDEIRKVVANGGRVLVTTLTKRMAEELTEYYAELGIRIRYLHSDIQTLERMEIIRELREGAYDVLVGINLLREGLDIPEVALVAILDADKEGFLRSERSLIQTIGRAARNAEGRVLLYADAMTDSLRKTIEVTERRREVQGAYNEEHGITPQTIKKKISSLRDSIWEGDYVHRRQARRTRGAGRPDPRAAGSDRRFAERDADRREGARVRARRRAARPAEGAGRSAPEGHLSRAVATSLAERADSLPTGPGVYLFKSKSGTVLYVGKAQNLRARVKQYVGGGDGRIRIRR